MNIAIIFAGGSGVRMGAGDQRKTDPGSYITVIPVS